jgi:hypothetical protein
MDYADISRSVTKLIKTAVPEGGNTSKYNKIRDVDQQRDIVVSHLKSTYTSETGEMINAKEFIDTSNTYKNLLKSTEGELQTVRSKEVALERTIVEQKGSVEKSKQVNSILQLLFITLLLVTIIYAIGGPWAHSLAFVVLIAGFGYVLYSRGETDLLDFSSIRQWISTTLGL